MVPDRSTASPALARLLGGARHRTTVPLAGAVHRANPVSERLTSAALAAMLSAALAGCSGTSVIEVGGPVGARCQASLGSLPTVAAEGGTIVVALVAARECTWQADSTASWLRVSPQSGQGSRDLRFDVSENRHLQSRTTAVTVNDQQFMLTQEALEPLLPWRRGQRDR